MSKATLCKKMVHDFLGSSWKDLFDRLLWAPLRRLKTWTPPEYNLEELFHHEYFTESGKGRLFAREIVACHRR